MIKLIKEFLTLGIQCYNQSIESGKLAIRINKLIEAKISEDRRWNNYLVFVERRRIENEIKKLSPKLNISQDESFDLENYMRLKKQWEEYDEANGIKLK